MKQVLCNPTMLFYIVMGLSLLVILIPKVNVVFRLFNTFIHESGHAFMALVTSGKVCNIKLNSNTSGQAVTASKYLIPRILVSLAGYTSCALVAYVIFYYSKAQVYNYIFGAFILLSIINIIFWVRNTFGIVWLILFITINALLIYYKIAWLNTVVLLFWGFILFFENIYSTLVLLKISAQEPKKSGDAANLAAATHIPAIVWTVLLTAFVGYFAFLTVTKFFPNPFI